MLIYPPGLDFIPALYGCLYAGAIAVPVPHLLPRRAAERTAAIAAAVAPAAVLSLSALANVAELRAASAELAGIPWLATDGMEPDQADDGTGPAAVDPATPAILQYTSGSTSAPKGVIVSHGNLLANMAMIRDGFGHDEHTRFVSWLPMFHDMGLVGCLLQPVYLGASCVTMSPLSFLQKPVRWLRAIAQNGGTTSGAPNFAFDLCTRNIRDDDCEGLDLRSWRVAFCGAEPVRPDTLRRFADRFARHGFRAEALFPCYGLSEAALFVSGGPPGHGMRTTTLDVAAAGTPAHRVIASSGRCCDGQDVVIVDPDTRRPVGATEIGEIWLAGPHVGLGYWQRPEETAAVFDGSLGDGRRFLRTGDLGFRLDDDLYVTGRLKDLIILRGGNHHPEDIEATATRSHPALAGAGAAAFLIEDGGEPRLIVLLEIDRRYLAGLDPGAVSAAAATAVTAGHGLRPHEIGLVRPGALPRTTSGKIQRHRCRSAYLAAELPRLGNGQDDHVRH
jgi:acyl-CoA synthetase (AMP-forming)/AMP-acid ligase II